MSTTHLPMSNQVPAGVPDKVEIVKCSCGSPVCKRHGLNFGTFYQGAGWDQDTAQFVADCINARLEQINADVDRILGEHADKSAENREVRK